MKNHVPEMATLLGTLCLCVACSRDPGGASPAATAPQQALTGPQRWMKKERPNELAVRVVVDEDCPGEASRYERTVGQALSHNRISRIPLGRDEMHLNVSIDCIQGEMMHVFSAEAEFVRVLDAAGAVTSLGPSYVESGLSSYSGILESSETVAERAISDYLTANFDL